MSRPLVKSKLKPLLTPSSSNSQNAAGCSYRISRPTRACLSTTSALSGPRTIPLPRPQSPRKHYPPRIRPCTRSQHDDARTRASAYVESPSLEPPSAPRAPFLPDPSQRTFFHRKPRHHIDAPTDDADVIAYLQNLFYPLQFPEEVALRMITHASWKGGMQGHNGRLIFLGRRTLRAYLYMFLTSAQVHRPASKFDVPPWDADLAQAAEDMLNTYALGQEVGKAWELERVMRWIPYQPDSTETARVLVSSGLYKVRGATVEGVMGGILHQHGGLIAHRAFQTRVLPHLSHRLPSKYQRAADEVTRRMGGLSGPLELAPPRPVELTPVVGLSEVSVSTTPVAPRRRTAPAERERIPIAK